MKKPLTQAEENLYHEYLALCHAMQTGVKYEIEKNPGGSATQPKHLRVGINSAMVENAAIIELLIEQNVFTLEMVFQKFIEKMREEVANYEARLSTAYGTKISLL